LDEGRNEIRVLKVSRPIQNGADAFQADLVCVSLDEDPAYLALSYAWGDTSVVGYFASHRGSQGRRIPYNKGIFDITNNILAPGTTLYLWIDALCINQEDLSERASQVAMMGTIFAQARQVIAFIGEADEISTTAMDFILRTVNCICAHGSISKSGTAPTLTTLLSEIGPAPRDCESIRGLISRRWFRRFWVVQEIALGNDPVLVCGKHSLQWCALELFIDLVYMAFESPESEHASFPICGDFLNVPRYLQNASAMLGARRGQRRDGLQPPFLFTLSSLSVTFESSDPRDRIYALLGLATAKKYRDVLLPNYEIRVEDLYVKLARQMLMSERNINFLHMAGIGHHRSLSLPSWVPDWTSLPREIFRNMDFEGFPVQERNAELCQPRFSFDQEYPNVLTLYGGVVDSISLIVRDSYPFFTSWRASSFYVTAAPFLDAVMELVHASYPEDQCEISSGRPWTKPLMETLSATGSPLATFWSPRQNEVDELGTTRTSMITEVGFGKFLERLRRWTRDQSVIPLTSVEEVDFASSFIKGSMQRRFYISSAGHFGLATEGARVGDYVCMFEGHLVPFIVRPVDGADKLKGGHLVGEAVSSFLEPSSLTEDTDLLHQYASHCLLGNSCWVTAWETAHWQTVHYMAFPQI
jgi:hypothetical protein